MTHESIKPLILIVDDTPTNIQVLAENLISDYRVKVATSGEDTFETILRQGAPDLILLDVMMPNMDGYEVCRRLKNNPETAKIPVIFISAMNGNSDEEKGLNVGALDYITKPFYLPVVKARIRNHIRLKQMTDMLETMVWIDSLTGISNRRRFDNILESEWKRAQRNRLPLALIMIDIDNFKAYNDHLGHGKGDECLKQVASRLLTTVSRSGDLVARYGGEEFVILMPETNSEGAYRIADQLCRRIEAEQIPHPASEISPWVTVSAGYASLVPELMQISTLLINEADRRLYRAKELGRNCVQGHMDQTVNGVLEKINEKIVVKSDQRRLF
ncbi:MAG: diguanylate cyclase [Gammaproteobacteria bacterium]